MNYVIQSSKSNIGSMLLKPNLIQKTETTEKIIAVTLPNLRDNKLLLIFHLLWWWLFIISCFISHSVKEKTMLRDNPKP